MWRCRAIAAGKHLLCQKPLSNQYGDAVRIVEAAERARGKLAVNQQMRWDAGIRVAKQLIDQGRSGRRPTRGSRSVSARRGTCGRGSRRRALEIMFHSIHYQDSCATSSAIRSG